MAIETEVLIVGGGPAGLVLALVLLENGIKVRIVDKMSGTRVGSRGNGIMPRMLEVLKFLGIIDEVMAEGVQDMVVQPYKPGSTEKLPLVRPFPKGDPNPAVPYPNAVALGQELLEGMLAKAILDRFGVKIDHGAELTSMDIGDDKVTAHLQITNADGTTSTQTAEAQYLVGTDGGHSRVRKELKVPFDGEVLPGTMIYGDIRVEGLEAGVSHAWSDDVKGRTIFFPASHRQGHPFALRVMLPKGNTVDLDALVADENAVRDYIRDIMGPRDDVKLGEFVSLTAYRPHARMVDQFSNGGRVFLAGDAAHCHSPAGGQGLNTSVQDSLNLGWKLAAAIQGRAKSSLLDSYSIERVPVVASMLNRTTLAFAKLQETSWKPTAQGGVPAFDKMMNQLGIHYAWSPIIVDDLGTVSADDAAGIANAKKEADAEAKKSGLPKGVDAYTAGPELHAGDRAPDATGLVAMDGVEVKETTLFDLFSLRSHLGIVFVDGKADVQDIASMLDALKAIGGDLVRPIVFYSKKPETLPEGIPAAQVFVDRDGHASHAYKPQRYGSVAATIVRPDGVVGAMVQDPKNVAAYFKKLYV